MTTPTLRLIALAIDRARTTVDRPVALHATDATWSAVAAELAQHGQTWRDWRTLAGIRVYSTARASRVVSAAGAEHPLEPDPRVLSKPSPVPKISERRRDILADLHPLSEIPHART